MKNNYLMIVVLVLVFAGVGFFTGMKYQESKQPAFLRQFGGGQQETRIGGQMQGGNRIGGRSVTGEIINQDEKSITVKLPDGSTKIVLLSDKTTVNKMAEGSKNDLKVGEQVGVFGTENQDGSVTAQNIQLNPMFRGATGGGTLR